LSIDGRQQIGRTTGDENLAISVFEGCQRALGGRFRVPYVTVACKVQTRPSEKVSAGTRMFEQYRMIAELEA
jgi:hypothetical protein